MGLAWVVVALKPRSTTAVKTKLVFPYTLFRGQSLSKPSLTPQVILSATHKLPEDIIYMPITTPTLVARPLLLSLTGTRVPHLGGGGGTDFIPYPLHLMEDLAQNGNSFQGG